MRRKPENGWNPNQNFPDRVECVRLPGGDLNWDAPRRPGNRADFRLQIPLGESFSERPPKRVFRPAQDQPQSAHSRLTFR